jgi:hypothetical protein
MTSLLSAAPATAALPAWSEIGYAAACADMANQIEAARRSGDEELRAANVCISSLCVAYKNAALRKGDAEQGPHPDLINP